MANGAFKARRAEVLKKLGKGVMILPAAPVRIRSRDSDYRYRPSNDTLFLTGFEEPEAVCVLAPEHEKHEFVMFVRPRDPEREVWDGHRAGIEGVINDFNADAAFPIAELERRLPEYLAGASDLHAPLGMDEDFDRTLLRSLRRAREYERKGKRTPHRIVDPALILGEMRLVKSDAEIAKLRRATTVTTGAHLDAMRITQPGLHEFEVEAALLSAFRRGNGECGYTPIVAGGMNATTLHYVDNCDKLEDGKLLLIDAGCEIDYYTADVTRTFPIGRTFSDEQREIYSIVLESQRAGIEEVRPGATLEAIHDRAVRNIIDGLRVLKFVDGSTDEILEKKTFKPFYMHKTSHWLGMDVHDVGGYFRDGKHRTLEPGMVLTVEPGIYISASAKIPHERWRGIGVRIEDDILVTQHGYENLTQEVPRAIADIEALTSAR